MAGTSSWLALALLLSTLSVSNPEPEPGAGGLVGVRLVAVAPAEQSAVVSTEPGRLELVASGEPLGETGFRVTGILPDRLLLEQSNDRADALTAWLFVAADGRSSAVRYFARRRPVPPAIETPPPPPSAENARSLIAVGAPSAETRSVAEGPK